MSCVVFQIQKYRHTAVVLAQLSAWGREREIQLLPFSALRPRFKSEGGKGEEAISGMCVQPNIFHSILIFVPTHLGGGFKIQKYINTAVVSGMCINPNISIFNKSSLIFVPNIWGAGNIFLGAVLE